MKKMILMIAIMLATISTASAQRWLVVGDACLENGITVVELLDEWGNVRAYARLQGDFLDLERGLPLYDAIQRLRYQKARERARAAARDGFYGGGYYGGCYGGYRGRATRTSKTRTAARTRSTRSDSTATSRFANMR